LDVEGEVEAEEDDGDDEEEDEEPEVIVFASSASNFDDELEHRKAPTVMASEATDAVLPSLTKVAPLAAVKGAPRGLVAALSLKAWQTAVGSSMLAATACWGVVNSWSSVTVTWIEVSPSPVLIETWIVVACREWRGRALARPARRAAEVRREDVFMLAWVEGSVRVGTRLCWADWMGDVMKEEGFRKGQ
jgi:hypothetical protein